MFKLTDAYIVGYYGMRNSGDDALLYAAAWAAKEVLGHRKIKASMLEDVNCPWVNDGEVMGEAKFRGHHRLCYYRSAWSSRQVIFGGGSVFHSASDINQKRHMIQNRFRTKSMAIGVSLGPFSNITAEKACREFLKECGFIGVRDQFSYDLAKSLAPDANIKLTFDLAPTLLCNSNFSFSNLSRRGIGLNFCQQAVDSFGNTDKEKEMKRVTNAVELIKQIWGETGEKIYLIDFNGHPKFGDHHVHQKIIAQLPSQISVHHVPYDSNPVRLLQRLFCFKAFIGMRLHAAILSYMAQTPVVSLQYHEKCRHWSEQIGMAEQLQFDANDYSPRQVTEQVCNGLFQQFDIPLLTVNQAIKQSLLNWSQDDEQHSIFRHYSTLRQVQ